MAFRRRVRAGGFGRRRSKPPLKWVSLNAFGPTSNLNGVAVNTTVTMSIIDTGGEQGGSFLSLSECTLYRTVGNVLVTNTSATGLAQVIMALCVVPLNSVGTIDASDFSLELLGNAEKRWLWLDQFALNLNGGSNLGFWNVTKFDVRVRRRLKNEALVLLMQWRQLVATPTVNFLPQVRALVGRVA